MQFSGAVCLQIRSRSPVKLGDFSLAAMALARFARCRVRRSISIEAHFNPTLGYQRCAGIDNVPRQQSALSSRLLPINAVIGSNPKSGV